MKKTNKIVLIVSLISVALGGIVWGFLWFKKTYIDKVPGTTLTLRELKDAFVNDYRQRVLSGWQKDWIPYDAEKIKDLDTDSSRWLYKWVLQDVENKGLTQQYDKAQTFKEWLTGSKSDIPLDEMEIEDAYEVIQDIAKKVAKDMTFSRYINEKAEHGDSYEINNAINNIQGVKDKALLKDYISREYGINF